MRHALAALSVCAAMAWTGCTPSLIPGTDVRDTAQNREILDVVGTYRNALEARNVEGVMKLVSKGFFEDSGTPDGSDDFDYNGLQAKLKTWAERTTTVRVAMEVKQITIDGARAKVRYYYDLNFLMPGPNNTPLWKRETDTKEMTLRRESGAWRIVSGV
jgi:SnoaL-like domain